MTRYLVQWRGHTSADDSWLRLGELAHCPEKVAKYDGVASRRRTARRAARTALPAAAPPAAPAPTRVLAPLVGPAGFRVAAQTEALAGTALVGQAVLYFWPDYGWVRGTVARRRRAVGFSHVARYSRASALRSVEAPSLLDAASLGPAGRWVLLRHTTRWLLFSGTTVMVRPAAGRIGEWTDLDPSACFGVALLRHEIVGHKGHGLVSERVLHPQ